MRIEELTIPQLNHWAAKALGWEQRLWGAIPVWFDPNNEGRYRCHVSQWNPCENWAQGGDIIERKKIGHLWDSNEKNWQAHIRVPRTKFYYHQTGKTALIASMRCVVRQRFGGEVPDE